MVKSLPVVSRESALDACESTVPAAVMGREEAEQLARAFKALGDPARIQILALIRASQTGELCACDFPVALGLSQPTVSHHLKVLTTAGLLQRRQRGTWAHFSIDEPRLAELTAAILP